MKRLLVVTLTGIVLLGHGILLSGCSAREIQRAGYEALQQRQCINQTGFPNCNKKNPNYDEYQRQRSGLPE